MAEQPKIKEPTRTRAKTWSHTADYLEMTGEGGDGGGFSDLGGYTEDLDLDLNAPEPEWDVEP